MAGHSDRRETYSLLVQKRQSCRACTGLVNPSCVETGRFDSGQIGPWSRWQGNQFAKLMVVGQDWGDTRCFITNMSREPQQNPTNETLMTLLASIGVRIPAPSLADDGGGPLFFTNAVLCLKEGGLQSSVKGEWFENCGSRFLRPTIDMVSPKVLVSLGERAYRAIRLAYGLPRMGFRRAVDLPQGLVLSDGTRYFPRYHCGRRILNTHRPLARQLQDWQRVGVALGESGP